MRVQINVANKETVFSDLFAIFLCFLYRNHIEDRLFKVGILWLPLKLSGPAVCLYFGHELRTYRLGERWRLTRNVNKKVKKGQKKKKKRPGHILVKFELISSKPCCFFGPVINTKTKTMVWINLRF